MATDQNLSPSYNTVYEIVAIKVKTPSGMVPKERAHFLAPVEWDLKVGDQVMHPLIRREAKVVTFRQGLFKPGLHQLRVLTAFHKKPIGRKVTVPIARQITIEVPPGHKVLVVHEDSDHYVSRVSDVLRD
jgi:hypothetical protein